jgi:hypothetical protein
MRYWNWVVLATEKYWSPVNGKIQFGVTCGARAQ